MVVVRLSSLETWGYGTSLLGPAEGEAHSALGFSSVKSSSLFFLQLELGQHKAGTSFRRHSAASNTVLKNPLKLTETGYLSPVSHVL